MFGQQKSVIQNQFVEHINKVISIREGDIMGKSYVMGRYYRRRLPCLYYKIAKIEAWLTDLANEGFILIDEGVHDNLFVFEYKGPQKVKYCLGISQKDAAGDSDSIESSKKYDEWVYVAKLKEFYIYRSFDLATKKPSVDSEVKAIVQNAIKKEKRKAISAFLLLLPMLYVLFSMKGGFLHCISIDMIWTLTTLFIVLFVFVCGGVSHKRMQQSLQREEYYSDSDWKKERRRGLLWGSLLTVFYLFYIVWSFVWIGGIKNSGENKIPLSENQGTVPFATIKDLVGEGDSDYALTKTGASNGHITEEEKNWIMTRSIFYHEVAKIKRADGQIIEGDLSVEYRELWNPLLARLWAKEVYCSERLDSSNTHMETPPIDADFAFAYCYTEYFPTIVIQKGNIVIRASFWQNSRYYKLPIEEWAKIICDSIGE